MAAQNGDDIAAAKLLREAVKSEPTNPVLLSDLGYALLRGGDISGARVPLAQAAELAPDNRKMIGNLALLLLVSGDREKANAIMDKATLSADSRATVYRLAAEIGQRQHQSGAVASQHVAGGNKPAAAGVATPASTSASPVTMRVTPFQSMLSRFGNGG